MFAGYGLYVLGFIFESSVICPEEQNEENDFGLILRLCTRNDKRKK